MNRSLFISALLFTPCLSPAVFASDSFNPLQNESFELALTNSNYTSGDYTTGRGIYVGVSAPLVVSELGGASVAADLGYGNLGTIKGETGFGDSNSVQVTSAQLGLRANFMFGDNVNAYLKGNVANVSTDASAFGGGSTTEGQLGLGVEFFARRGLAFNLAYQHVAGDIRSLMLGISIR